MRHLKKKVILPILVIVVVVILSALKLNLLLIQKINLSEEKIKCVSLEQVFSDLKIRGLYWFQVDSNKIQEKLVSKYPCIKSIALTYKSPWEVDVHLTGRSPLVRVDNYQPKVLLNLDQLEASSSSQSALLDWSFPEIEVKSYFVSDNEGVIFDLSSYEQFPVLFIPKGETSLGIGQKLNSRYLRELNKILAKLSDLEISYQGFRLDGKYLLINTQPRVVFNLGNSQEDYSDAVNRQLASLQLILQKSTIDGRVMELIDLRFDKPVVIYAAPKRK